MLFPATQNHLHRHHHYSRLRHHGHGHRGRDRHGAVVVGVGVVVILIVIVILVAIVLVLVAIVVVLAVVVVVASAVPDQENDNRHQAHGEDCKYRKPEHDVLELNASELGRFLVGRALSQLALNLGVHASRSPPPRTSARRSRSVSRSVNALNSFVTGWPRFSALPH